MNDSGVLSHILNITTIEELLTSPKKGDLIETFVYSELLKHISYSNTLPKLYHYRTNDKKEIDFIVEKGEKILAIEVKASKSIALDAFKHIIDFQNKSKTKDVLGIVLYMGESVVPFGDEKFKRFAIPMSLFF
jgi:predicted AAA+ superfamily ATPase